MSNKSKTININPKEPAVKKDAWYVRLAGATCDKCRPAVIWLARGAVVLFILANALANIIRWFDGKHVTHEMAIGAGVTTLAVCLYVYFIKK